MGKSEKTQLGYDGLVLSPQAIERLKFLQKNDNENLYLVREHIADAICFIATRMDTAGGEEVQKLKHLLCDLSFVRDYIGELQKP